MIAGLDVGLGLIILALAFIELVVITGSLRRAQRNIPVAAQADSPFTSPNSSHINEAVLIVQSGGRGQYINELTREWFALRPDGFTDPQFLLRRARPGED